MGGEDSGKGVVGGFVGGVGGGVGEGRELVVGERIGEEGGMMGVENEGKGLGGWGKVGRDGVREEEVLDLGG